MHRDATSGKQVYQSGFSTDIQFNGALGSTRFW